MSIVNRQATQEPGKTRTLIYCRVSLEKMAERGVSLEAQQAKAEAYAALYDLEVTEVIIDAGASAKTLVRPGLERALSLLKAGKADAILVAKLDRLTRSVRDLNELVTGPFAPGKAALLSVSEQIDTRSAGGRLVLNVLASVSQWEREAIGERTSTALQHKAAQGGYTGGNTRYGFRLGDDGEHLVPVPEEQQVVEEARKLRAQGLTLRDVAAKLEDQGRVSRTGRRFGPAQIRQMAA